MISILTWVSIIAGGVLVLLFLISFIGGLDLDVEVGSTDVDTDAGGLGLIKGFLTFISVSSWVMKVLLVTNKHPGVAITIGVLSGLVSFLILNYLFKALLSNQENVNYTMQDALMTTGEVYLKIPGGSDGSGIVNLSIRGANRELKAKSKNQLEIATGTQIKVVDVEDDIVIVEKIKY